MARSRLLQWLEVLLLYAWASVLLKSVVSGQIRLLIHPNYIGLVVFTDIVLIVLASLRTRQLLRLKNLLGVATRGRWLWSSLTILLVTAIAAWVIAPRPLGSQIALKRGVRETLPITRTSPETFRLSTQPEERSLIDWVRTINAYPEPDAYAGDPVDIEGFIIHDPKLPQNYLLVARFSITCCAVDAYPVALPVKIEGSRERFPPDTWVRVQGEAIVTSFPNTQQQRQIAIAAHNIDMIPTPADPYKE